MQPQTTRTAPTPLSLTLRPPTAADGLALHQLVAQCPPLDPNSIYCNLLHCTHFAGTSVAAVDASGQQAGLLGFISAYLPPAQPDTLFVWQVAVAPLARGQGLAGRMLDAIATRPACRAIRYLETTINPSNSASWALFQSWAQRHQAAHSAHPHFDSQQHFGGVHEDEMLMRIGPFAIAAEGPV